MDCLICLPECFPENEDAERIYFTVQDQYITGGMGGPIALNQVAIHEAMDLYEIEFKKDTFEKVVTLGRHFIQKMNDEAKEKKK